MFSHSSLSSLESENAISCCVVLYPISTFCTRCRAYISLPQREKDSKMRIRLIQFAIVFFFSYSIFFLIESFFDGRELLYFAVCYFFHLSSLSYLLISLYFRDFFCFWVSYFFWSFAIQNGDGILLKKFDLRVNIYLKLWIF